MNENSSGPTVIIRANNSAKVKIFIFKQQSLQNIKFPNGRYCNH